MVVIKRDGRITEFNEDRIVNAITLAMATTEKGIDIDLAKDIANDVKKKINDKNQVTVYEIQDLVEKDLMGSSRKEVAEKYITYRYTRDIARKAKSKDVFIEMIESKTKSVDKDSGINTPEESMMKFARETMKPFVDDFLLSDDSRKAVKDGFIYINNKDYYPTRSISSVHIPLEKILNEGFKSQNGEVRPARRLESAISLALLSLVIIQNEMHGTQDIPNFDYLLAPYVKKAFIEEIEKIEEIQGENLTKLKDFQPNEYIFKQLHEGGIELKDDERFIQIAINNTVDRVHQGVEGFIHDINVLGIGRSSINYGTCTSPEGRLIIRELLNTTMQGLR